MAMTNERRILLILLVVASVVSGGIVLVPVIRTERAAIEESIAQHEAHLIELQGAEEIAHSTAADLAALEERYDQLSSRFYDVNEIDPYLFASRVSDRIAAQGMTIVRSQPRTDESGGQVEIEVRGRASELLAFLSGISEQDQLWSVPFVSVVTDANDDRTRIRLQVEYETFSRDDR